MKIILALKKLITSKKADISLDLKLYRRAAFESKVLRLCDLEKKGDQGAISRRDPLPPPPRDVLEQTVYVEGPPKDATKQWLQVNPFLAEIIIELLGQNLGLASDEVKISYFSRN